MWNKIVLVYFESYFNAGTCLDRILCQYLLCKSYYTAIAHCLRVNDEIKSVHIHLLKIKLDTF